jgi:hypothetical protein
MPINLEINAITGTSPYDIYICDTSLSNCIYISTITTLDLTPGPYPFPIPLIYQNTTNLVLKIVDD